jgi:integrase
VETMGHHDMAGRLTDATIKRLALPGKGSRIYPDGDVPGFGVRVTAAGAKSFVLRYRTRGSGRERTFTIGGFPTWQVAAARTEARRLRRLVDQGEDPVGNIEAAREAPTVHELLDRFVAEHVEPRLRANSVRHYKMLIGRHVRPHFGAHVKVADVEFEHIDDLHRKVTRDGGPYIANRTVAVLSKAFALACRWKMRDDNPCRGIERNYEAKRRRYLQNDELARLVKALAEHPNRQASDIIRLTLLTGCRVGEAMSALWADIDLGAGIWSKPGSATKQAADHVAPLNAPARALLAEIQQRQTTAHRPLGQWVFPSHGVSGHVTQLPQAWKSICASAGIEGLRIHDLRHSFASLAASGGASLPLIGALLGHSDPAMTSRYAHLLDDPLRRTAEQVGAVIAAAGKDAASPVETFPKGCAVAAGKKHRRMSKREREEAQRKWRREQEEREWREAEIVRLEQLGLSHAQVREELGLVEIPLPPATEFICARLKGASSDDPLFDSKWKQAVVDLAASDVPLDSYNRRLIAGELRRLYFPNAARDRREKRRFDAAVIEATINSYLSIGMSVKDAEQKIVETLGPTHGIANVAALRKRLQLRGLK